LLRFALDGWPLDFPGVRALSLVTSAVDHGFVVEVTSENVACVRTVSIRADCGLAVDSISHVNTTLAFIHFIQLV